MPNAIGITHINHNHLSYTNPYIPRIYQPDLHPRLSHTQLRDKAKSGTGVSPCVRRLWAFPRDFSLRRFPFRPAQWVSQTEPLISIT
eukprot:139697-Pyramimonas_sp.AAC.1